MYEGLCTQLTQLDAARVQDCAKALGSVLSGTGQSSFHGLSGIHAEFHEFWPLEFVELEFCVPCRFGPSAVAQGRDIAFRARPSEP